MKPLPPRVRAMLVCPRCHGVLVDEEAGLRCDACRVVYPMADGVPVLLKDAGRPAGRATG